MALSYALSLPNVISTPVSVQETERIFFYVFSSDNAFMLPRFRMANSRYKKVIDLVTELQKLPQKAKIAIEVFNRSTDEWDNATPTVVEDHKHKDRYVISYDPEEIELKK